MTVACFLKLNSEQSNSFWDRPPTSQFHHSHTGRSLKSSSEGSTCRYGGTRALWMGVPEDRITTHPLPRPGADPGSDQGDNPSRGLTSSCFPKSIAKAGINFSRGQGAHHTPWIRPCHHRAKLSKRAEWSEKPLTLFPKCSRNSPLHMKGSSHLQESPPAF